MLKLRDLLLALLFLILVGFLALFVTDGTVQDIDGYAYVVDGDSIEILGNRIRIADIDAPELAQECTIQDRNWSCGMAAAKNLQKLINGKQVFCKVARRDKFKRLLADCSIGDEQLGRSMVKDGYAISLRKYQSEQNEAEKNGRGIWKGEFEMPAEWRQKNL